MLCLLGFVFLNSCNKPSHDSLMEDAAANLEHAAEILEGVDDAESARAAVPELRKISADMKEWKEQVDEIGDPSEAKKKELQKKYGDRMSGAMRKLAMASLALAKHPDAAKILEESMMELNTAISID